MREQRWETTRKRICALLLAVVMICSENLPILAADPVQKTVPEEAVAEQEELLETTDPVSEDTEDGQTQEKVTEEAEANPQPDEVAAEETPVNEAAIEERNSQELLDYIVDQVLVVYDTKVSEEEVEEAVEQCGGEVAAAAEAPQEKAVAVVDIPDEATVAEAVEELSAQACIEYAQPNYIYTVQDTEGEASVKEQPWYAEQIGAGGILSGEAEGNKTKVAVIDTGIDISDAQIAAILDFHASVAIDENGDTTALTGAAESNHGTKVARILAETAGDHVELIAVDQYLYYGIRRTGDGLCCRRRSKSVEHEYRGSPQHRRPAFRRGGE